MGTELLTALLRRGALAPLESVVIIIIESAHLACPSRLRCPSTVCGAGATPYYRMEWRRGVHSDLIITVSRSARYSYSFIVIRRRRHFTFGLPSSYYSSSSFRNNQAAVLIIVIVILVEPRLSAV